MHSRHVGLAALTVVGALAFAGCGSSGSESSSGDASETYKIGFAVGQTGFMQQYDTPYLNAGRMAIDDFNAEGGVNGRKLEAVVADTKSTPDGAATAGLSLISKGANFAVISGDFDVGGPAAVQTTKQDVIGFSAGAGSTKFGPLGIGPLAYTMAGTATSQGAIMAEYAASQGVRRAYVLVDSAAGDFSKQLCEGFSLRFKQVVGGNAVAGTDTFKQTDQSLATQVTRLRGAAPDGVMMCSYMPGAGNAIRQIRAAGIKTPIFGQQDFDGDAWKKAVPNVSDVYYPAIGSIYGDDPDEQVNTFVERYTERYGKPANSFGIQGYAVLQAFKTAAERADSVEGTKLAGEFDQFKDVPLLVGPTRYSAHAHIRVSPTMRIMSITDGKTKFEKLATAEAVPTVGD